MSSNESNKKNKAVLWIILNVVQVLVIGGLAFMLITKNDEIKNLKMNLDDTEANLTTTASELFAVRDRLIETKKKYKKLGLEKDELDAQLAELDEYVKKLNGKIKLSEAERKKLQNFVAKLEADLVKKDKEIERLTAENQDLSTQVEGLIVDKKELGDSLEVVTVNKKQLDEFILAAAVLSVDEMKISALNKNGKEFQKDEYKRKSIDRLKIAFSLDDNKAAKKENKRFYVQLILPSGEIFSDVNNGGGSTTLNNGTKINYTMAQDVNFDNTGQELTFTMLKGFNYVPGNYIVDVACEGEVIGSGFFNVK